MEFGDDGVGGGRRGGARLEVRGWEIEEEGLKDGREDRRVGRELSQII